MFTPNFEYKKTVRSLFRYFARSEKAIMMKWNNEDIFKPAYAMKNQDNISGII